MQVGNVVETVLQLQKHAGKERWFVHLLNQAAPAQQPLNDLVDLAPLTLTVNGPLDRAFLSVANHPVKVQRLGKDRYQVKTDQIHLHEIVILDFDKTNQS